MLELGPTLANKSPHFLSGTFVFNEEKKLD
jgi:hypothetical protein